MILSNATIRSLLASGHNIIDGIGEGAIQPASVDVRMDATWRRQYSVEDTPVIGDVDENGFMEGRGPLLMAPGDFVLASTMEEFNLPSYLAAEVSGKSTWGRKGLIVHTAGWADPGFKKANLTLELKNVGKRAFWLIPGEYIAQVKFLRLDTVADPVYEGRYQGQRGVQGALPALVVVL